MRETSCFDTRTRKRWRQAAMAGLTSYVGSTIVAVLAIHFGLHFLAVRHNQDFVSAMLAWDGKHYLSICEDGYQFDVDSASNVAFFPAYPATARVLVMATGLPANLALVILSNVCLAGSFVLFARYAYMRGIPLSTEQSDCSLAAFTWMPAAFFFHMGYSESMLLLLAIAAFVGMQSRWNVVLIALLIGAATATRPVGIALVPAFMFYLWQEGKSIKQTAIRALLLLPMSCWGLIAYMTYLLYRFDSPLAFALTQSHWRMRSDADLPSRIMALVTLEPIWSVYVSGAPGYWLYNDFDRSPWFSMLFANPIYFVGFVLALLWGGWNRWLDTREVLLAGCLLAIPYLTRSFEMCMASHARFAAVAFPCYFVWGRLASQCSFAVRFSLYSLAAFYFAAYAALFATGLFSTF